MQTQSILYQALGLFGLTLLLVAALFGAVLWWVARQGGRVHARVRDRARASDSACRPRPGCPTAR